MGNIISTSKIQLNFFSFNVLAFRYAVKYGNLEAFVLGITQEKWEQAKKDGTTKDLLNLDRYPYFLKIFEGLTTIGCLQEVDVELFNLLKSSKKIKILAYDRKLDEGGDNIGNVTICCNLHLDHKVEIQQVREHDLNGKVQVLSVFTIDDKQVSILNVHLPGYWRENPNHDELKVHSARGFESITNFPGGLPPGTIICGDFNADLGKDKYQGRCDYIRDNALIIVSDPGITEPKTQTKIDYILVPSNLASSVKTWELTINHSDHLPTTVTLEI